VTRAARHDLVIIGAGPAGIVAAREAADLGVRVALIECALVGGTSLNTGSVPSKSLIRAARHFAERKRAAVDGAPTPADFTSIMWGLRHVRARISRVDAARRLHEQGVDVFLGKARFVAADRIQVDDRELPFKKAIIATGARAERPVLPGLAESGYLTDEDVFDLEALPARLLVVGGGPLGCELAQALCRLGCKTTIVQDVPLFLPKEERDAAQILSDALARDDIDVRLNTHILAVRTEKGEKQVDLISDDYRSTVTVDQILVGAGRRPNVDDLDLEAAGIDYDASGVHVDDHLRTTNKRVFAAGDVCLEYKFTHTAEASARIVVANALRGGRRRWSQVIVPWCTFTDPEIAHVGLQVRDAHERDIPIRTFTVPMHDVDRAVTDREEIGFVKIHVEEGSDRILGATIVGWHAGEMIHELTLAMEAGIGLERIASVLHTYPTHGTSIQQAALAYVRARSQPIERPLRAPVEDRLACAAVAGIQSGMTVGLGTGRAATRAARALASRVLIEPLEIVCVATSAATEALARSLDLRTVPLESVARIDVLIDGADEVDPALRMIKGRGGAMTEEKRVAHAAAHRTYAVQSKKLVEQLGTTALLPIEVERSKLASVRRRVAKLGLETTVRRREDRTEFRTDGGNPVIDAVLPALDLEALAASLDAMSGVVGHGLFLDEADLVLIEDEHGEVSRRSRT
jgi:ribose 5-phosphate isomerase